MLMQVYLALLSRCRLMQQLTGMQQPKGGCWSQLGGRVLQHLETLAQHPTKSVHPTDRAGIHNNLHSCADTTTAPNTTSRSVAPAAATAEVPARNSISGSSSSRAGLLSQEGGGAHRSAGKRRTGSAKPSAAAAGSNAVLDAAADAFDEDGLRYE